MDMGLPGSGTGYCGLDTKCHPNCSSTSYLIPWLVLQIWRGSESSGRWLFEESDHCGTFFMLYLFGLLLSSLPLLSVQYDVSSFSSTSPHTLTSCLTTDPERMELRAKSSQMKPLKLRFQKSAPPLLYARHRFKMKKKLKE